MGTGDVKRKRQAFEQQIKAKSVDEKLMDHPAGNGTTASEAATASASAASEKPTNNLENNENNASIPNKVARRIVELNEDEIAGMYKFIILRKYFFFQFKKRFEKFDWLFYAIWILVPLRRTFSAQSLLQIDFESKILAQFISNS